MPVAASTTLSLEELTAQLTISFPTPTPTKVPDLVTTKDLHREEDLLRNPSSFRHWWTAIQNVKETAAIAQKLEGPSDLTLDVAALLGPFSSPSSRKTFQQLTYLYEAALAQFPTSFKLWRSYLQTRMSYVLGKLVTKKRAGGRKKFPEMREALEEEKEDLEQWEGGLDGVVGLEEWKALVATFERALMWLPRMPRLWLLYVSIFNHPFCPPVLSHTHARHTYDRALRTLPPSLHSRIWVRYLLWAEGKGGVTTVAIYRRYLAVDPSVTERYTAILLSPENPAPRPLEAAKLLLSLARKAAKGEYTSPEGKSPYQLLCDWLAVAEQYAEQVGMDVEETEASHAAFAAAAEEKTVTGSKPSAQSVSKTGDLIRFAGPAVNVGPDGKPLPDYDEDEDPLSTRKLNCERIIYKDGLEVYKDQAGRLWTGLATYWVKRAEFDRAEIIFEKGVASVLTIRDFTQIFDSYAEFSETLIRILMQSLENPDEDEEDLANTEEELDAKMKQFEQLMDRRPFLLNDVLLRRNPNDVQEWEKRVALWGENDEKVAETYEQALSTVNPRQATTNLHRLYINFAKFYEEGGTTGEAEADLDSARKVLEKATKVNFKNVDDLAEVWCEWAELEIRHENYDEAIRVMQRAAVVPKNPKVNYHDHSLSAQTRLFKSLKLWSFYVDLEESLGTVATAKAVYDKILELRIANAQIIVNYAAFLEENDYFEESFKVYERGVELFTFPVSFEIWNIYLAKFIKRYGGTKVERTRDLFEQALEKCPEKSCKPIFMMYAAFEEDHGLIKRAMAVYDRATKVVADADKFELFTIYIAKATANYGLPATRPIYERALEVLPDKQTAEMCLRFASMERKLGEIDRARAIYAHASQFCDPRVNPKFWAEWNSFEIETGSEDTFREMLRIKRSVQAQFNTEASYLAAQMAIKEDGVQDDENEDEPSDPMAATERQAAGGKPGPAFVASKSNPVIERQQAPEASATAANQDEIHISDDEDM
ncbi:protein prenylyltransferase [Cristinia sonorae]|uniref:Pre-mRNA-splicing factor SYF1 n=1 Tax=Cristinia sonorae TaxID=1940300 RepID=A0A8K0XVG8_9AGAR|nr:protein prenylyltransferase [Cristinia sonorae]